MGDTIKLRGHPKAPGHQASEETHDVAKLMTLGMVKATGDVFIDPNNNTMGNPQPSPKQELLCWRC